MHRIMVVEDDERLSEMLVQALRRYGYEAFGASHLDEITSEFLSSSPDLVILDINLPYMDGFYWCRQIRRVSKVPIMFISVRTDDLDQVRAIENGADDYITKPFNMELALAKITGLLRRTYGEYSTSADGSHDVREIRGLFLYRMRNEVEYRDKKTILTPKESSLLEILTRKPGDVVSREDLLEALWDDVLFVDDNTLTVNIARLRRKLEDIGIKGAISTVRGQGYRLDITWGDHA